jgi:hypothetical protein
VVQTSWSGEQFELPAGDEPRLQVAGWTTETPRRSSSPLAGQDLDELVESRAEPRFPPGAARRDHLLRLTRSRSRGRDRQRARPAARQRSELARRGRRLHRAPRPPRRRPAGRLGDTIYNGALDNASGVRQLLAMARAFKALPEPPGARSSSPSSAPRSRACSARSTTPKTRPSRPADRRQHQLRRRQHLGRTRDITYIGYGKSSLDAWSRRPRDAEPRRQGRPVPRPRLFYRSDQFNFAKIGVPALYLDNGTDFVGRDPEFGKQLQERYESTCYHQPCDEISDEWDLAGMVEDTQIGFYAGLAVANADAMPTWNPGDEFEAAARISPMSHSAPPEPLSR